MRRKLREADMHLTCGFLGIRFLLPALCDVGMIDEAYAILCQRTYPGWCYSVECGATTIWEHWNSNSADELKGMNSFNHYSLGSFVEWIYEYCLGIRAVTEKPAFEKALIKPCICKSGRITSAHGAYNTKRGRIDAGWERTEDGFYRYSLSVPAGIAAEYDFGGLKLLSQAEKDGTTVFLLQ